jgi:hypothetical protein
MPRSGEQVRGRRACESLERGGASPEGTSGPRARRNLTRGGIRPSSEVEPHPRGRPALERGGALPEGVFGPRASRSLVSAVLCLTSEVEFRPRVAGANRSGGPLGPPGPWAPAAGSWSFRVCFIVVSSFVFCFLRTKVGFSWFFREPLWLSPTVDPEPLRWYPLGSRRG